MKKLITLFLSVCIILNMGVFAVNAETEDNRMESITTILSELSVMQGDPDGNMRYSDLVSRAEFSKVAVMASSYKDYVVPGMKISVFSDVKGDMWFTPYVWVGVKNSMFSGYPDGTFLPNNTVLYEEAANVLLRLLGYSESDIGPSWPQGPVALASNIGLDENIEAYAGKVLTRFDVANMVYNMLKATPKGGSQDYINGLGYSIMEDTMLIASYEQDTSIGVDNIYTSAGSFEISKDFDKDSIGLRGDLVVKDNKKAVCLIPSGQKKVTHTVTGTIAGGLMLDGKLYNIDENLNVYYGKQQHSYKDLYALSINKGDEFSFIYTDEGFIDYAVLVDKSKSFEVSELEFEKYVVYSVVNNDVIFYKDGKTTTYNISDNTTIYKEDTKMTYSSIKGQLEMGDVFYLNFNSDGEIEYAEFEEGTFIGPVVASSSWKSSFGVDLNGVSFMRNGARVTEADITSNDVLYYCKDLNLVLAYYKTVTGVYEKAIPNRDTPTSVTISGKTYELEGIDAFNKLSSNGNISLGDTVTVVFGKDDKIANVITGDNLNDVVYGYLVETGVGKYTKNNGDEYSSNYVKIILPNGEESEFATSKDYDDYLNRIVRVAISAGKTTVSVYKSSGGVSGEFQWANKSVGDSTISDDISILDVRTIDDNKAFAYVNVFPQRLDGIYLSEDDIYYAGKDENGRVCELILADVTADSWEYGILSSAVSANNRVAGYKIYNSNGNYQTSITGIGGMAVGKGVKLAMSGNSIESIQMLSEVKNVSEITETMVVGTTNHTIANDVEVYVRSGSMSEGYTYNYTDLTSVIGIDESKIISVYYDKDDSKGGRVRVILVKE